MVFFFKKSCTFQKVSVPLHRKSTKMFKEYESFNHAKTHIRYHVIFSTKYRRHCLDGIKEDLFGCFNDIASHSHFKILRAGVDGDHVHLLVKSCPTFSIYQIVRRLKQVSTRRMWKSHEDYLRKYYWGKCRKLWTNGYFCSTIGEMSEETVRKYIENQG